MKFYDHYGKKHKALFGAILGNRSKKTDDFVRSQMPSHEETTNENEHLNDAVTKEGDSGTPYIDVIRKHWNRAVVTDVWQLGTNEQEVAESELLPGELRAVTFRVGCYIVRSASRVYKDGTPVVRAEGEESWEYMRIGLIIPQAHGLEYRQEISARHNANPNNLFTYICHANYYITVAGGIQSIFTAKEHKLIPDEYASLFVGYRYKFDPTGKITPLSEWHPV